VYASCLDALSLNASLGSDVTERRWSWVIWVQDWKQSWWLKREGIRFIVTQGRFVLYSQTSISISLLLNTHRVSCPSPATDHIDFKSLGSEEGQKWNNTGTRQACSTSSFISLREIRKSHLSVQSGLWWRVEGTYYERCVDSTPTHTHTPALSLKLPSFLKHKWLNVCFLCADGFPRRAPPPDCSESHRDVGMHFNASNWPTGSSHYNYVIALESWRS